MFLKIGVALSVLARVLAFTVPRLGSRWFKVLGQSFGKLARRCGLPVRVVGKGRHIWLVYADDNPPRLEPYSECQVASGAGRASLGLEP